jgi:hypothetical protein
MLYFSFKSYTQIQALQFLKYVLVKALNFYWPAVSQICKEYDWLLTVAEYVW